MFGSCVADSAILDGSMKAALRNGRGRPTFLADEEWNWFEWRVWRIRLWQWLV